MEVSVKVISVLPEQSGTSKSGNKWRLKSFIGETQERYPKKICFDLFGDNLITNNPVEIDDKVVVSFDIESQEYNSRWYTKIRAWKIIKEEDTQISEQQVPQQDADVLENAAASQSLIPTEDANSDYPF